MSQSKYADMRQDIIVECRAAARDIEARIKQLEDELGLPVFLQVETQDTNQIGGSSKPFIQNIDLKPVL